jgi:amino acid transporter
MIALLNFFSVTSWTFYLLTVLGLLVLRVKEPHLNRPYKAWIITPITFCIVSAVDNSEQKMVLRTQVAAFLLLMPIFAAPLEAFAAFGEWPRCISCRVPQLISVFMSAGVPMYYLTARSRAMQASKSYADDGGGVRAIVEGG